MRPEGTRLALLLGLLAGALGLLVVDPFEPGERASQIVEPGPYREPAPTRRRVALVTVDTLRADALGIAGHPLPTTPFLDELLARGQRFARAVTPVPRTTPALASLLTGAYPHTTKVRSLVDPLAPQLVSVAELFRARGYCTLAVVSNHVLRRERGLFRGFEVYDYSGDGRDAFATTRAALRHVGHCDREEPVFLWAHYIDPHMPYAPPPGLARAFDPSYAGPHATRFGGEDGATGERAFPADLPKRAAIYRNPLPETVNEHIRRLYAAEVRYTDAAVRELVSGLENARGPFAVIFAADHGESLGEQDYFWEHGDYVYDSSIRVPLSFVLPQGDPLHGARVHDEWVSLVDVMPTLVELFDLPLPADLPYPIEGRSLVPLLRGEALSSQPVFAESGRSHYPDEIRRRVSFDVAGRFRAVLEGDWKLIWTPGQRPELEYELYRLTDDPSERRNLYGSHPTQAEHLKRRLAGWLRAVDDRSAEPDARDLVLLRRLGYVE